MSEYQYYEFVAIDRALDEWQLAELRALSSRADITPTSFVNTYHWGDLRGDPRVWMGKYFDAFLYLANWGTGRFMLRLPAAVLDCREAERYCIGDAASVWAVEDNVVVDLVSMTEDGDDYFDESGEGRLASIVPARADLAAGDLRMLYLGWLLCVQQGEADDGEVEPPVPPGLGSLPASLRALADLLRLDADLLDVASDASSTPAPTEISDMERWVRELPEAEKDALLVALVRGDDPHLRTTMVRRSRGTPENAPGSRTAGELRGAAATRRGERERAAEREREQQRVERERRAEAARERRLAAVATEGEGAWQRVGALIATRKPVEYDAAVALLQDLRVVDDPAVFGRRITDLRAEHGRKPSLMERLERFGM